LLENQE